MDTLDEQLESLPKGSLIKIIKDINKDIEEFSSDGITEDIKIHNQIKGARLKLSIVKELDYVAKQEEQ
tara:strand:- start:89 stop:292 length:204 start_codon:yes stop_codon:yes gene_type:complete